MNRIRTLLNCALLMLLATSGDISAQWSQCSSLTSAAVMAFGAKGTYLFLGTDGDGSYRSTDSGTTWTRMVNGLSNNTGFAFTTLGRHLFLGNTGGVYRSTDDGLSWTSMNLNALVVRHFLVLDTTLLACGDGGIYVSADSGITWVRTDTSGVTVGYNFSLTTIGGDILDGSNGAGVFRSADRGMHWVPSSTGLNNMLVKSLVTDGSTVYAGTSGGVYRSTDNGFTWGMISASNIDARGLRLVGARLFVATSYQGVLFTDDSGAHWSTANTGFAYQPPMNDFVTSGDRLFVGTYGLGAWRRPLTEFEVGVSDNPSLLPVTTLLAQNYPNPFNPGTTLRYTLAERSRVTLTLFDALGQGVRTLEQGEREAGIHEVRLEATELSSGAYFIRLSTGDFTQTRKILLLR